ncbi:hypothetical protein PI124_g13553 [Phytophthora idaei]|nr:hypothetical protein PI125_g14372 [Phytophthora idaei]KAG3145832.1 hypothetical protein PI126_g13577 [Phytophthora idaei]KAG3241583.1 hypothetical protein PI124_g13553 [Phytophthora idaei]
MPKKSARALGTIEDRLRARLDDPNRTSEADIKFRAQVEFYAQYRQNVVANGDSIGIEILDGLADAHMPPHVLFTPAATSTRTAKRLSVRGSDKKTLAKKQRQTKTKFDFHVLDGVDNRIRRDLARITKLAADQSKAPFLFPYPWRGQKVWYDPIKYRRLHLFHYRS